jgi:integrase
VGRLRRGEVEGRKKWTPRSCNYLLHLATAVLDDQVKQGNIVRNVARLVDRVAAAPSKYRTLTADEMFTILDHDCRDRHLWALALYGLRRGEIAGLRWANVDLKAKTVSVVENRVVVGEEVVVDTPKSKASNRALPMPDEVVEVLRAARKRQAEERLAFGQGYGPGEYVASDEAGQSYHPDRLTSAWGRMLDELGIKRVRLHDARHSCATLMHLRGLPIAVIAAWLGHASAAFTLSVYAHSQDDALKAAAGSFARVDAPIAVKASSGDQPSAVVVGEGFVALVSAFESRDGDDRDAEMSGDGGQGDVFGLSGRPQVAVVVDRSGSSQQSEHFAGDGSFE